MNETNLNKLKQDFPDIFKPPYDFSCGDGWYDLIYPLCQKLSEIGGNISQVKEKFGGLRFYISFYRNELSEPVQQMYDLIYEAEKESFTICEYCGKPGEKRSMRGWLKTLCDKCYKEK